MDNEVVTRTVLKEVLQEVLNEELNHELAKFFGQVVAYFDARLEKFQTAINASINRIDRQSGALVKKADDVDLEQVAIGYQLDRHKGWIGQLADKTETSLDPALD